MSLVRIPPPKGENFPVMVSLELYWSLLGPKPPGGPNPVFWDWDGLTASPDSFFGYDLRPAGYLHDYAAHIGAVKRHTFGFLFYRNLFRCIRYQGGSRFVAGFVALIYSTIVVPAYRVRGWLKGLFR